MKRSEFLRFKETVMVATKDDPVWWAGYLWLNLTNRQIAAIRSILYARADDFEIDEHQITLPSGIGVLR